RCAPPGGTPASRGGGGQRARMEGRWPGRTAGKAGSASAVRVDGARPRDWGDNGTGGGGATGGGTGGTRPPRLGSFSTTKQQVRACARSLSAVRSTRMARIGAAQRSARLI